MVPITTLRQRLLTTPTQGPDDVTLLFVGFEDEDSLLAGQKEIKRLLRDRYRVQKGKINPFTVRTTTEIAETTGQVTQIFQAVLVAIASISLFVRSVTLTSMIFMIPIPPTNNASRNVHAKLDCVWRWGQDVVIYATNSLSRQQCSVLLEGQ